MSMTIKGYIFVVKVSLLQKWERCQVKVNVNQVITRDRLGVDPPPPPFFLNNVRNVTDIDAKLGIPFHTSM